MHIFWFWLQGFARLNHCVIRDLDLVHTETLVRFGLRQCRDNSTNRLVCH
jgi:hypothetical protein